MSTPARRLAIPALLALALGGCGSRSPDVRADLCEDLIHLRPTVAMLVDPPLAATVGSVRSALDKLDPTFERLEGSGVVAEPEREALLRAQSDYRLVIQNMGDDEPLAVIRSDLEGEGAGLGAAFESVLTDLSCAQARALPMRGSEGHSG